MSVAFGSTTDEIDVEVRVTGPQGEFVDSYYEFLEDPGTYRGEVFICSSLDPDGLYTISLVEGTAYDFEFNNSSVNAAPVSFTVFPPPAPPAPPPPSPPPPSPAPVVDVEGKTPRVFKLVGARRFEVRLATKPLPAGSIQGKKFKWLVKIDGRQVLSFSQGPSTSRKWQSKALSPSKHKIVIKGNGVIRFKGTARF
nr:hypothetical protein [uncultured Nocardioides sp.]